MTSFNFLPPGTPSSAPKIGSLRERLSRMHNGLRDTARSGGGLGSGDLDGLAAELGAIIGAIPANEAKPKQVTVNETIARACTDMDKAITEITSGIKALRASLDEDEADPGGIATRGITSALGLLMRAQSSLGAARIART